jgi:hypothetical protein
MKVFKTRPLITATAMMISLSVSVFTQAQLDDESCTTQMACNRAKMAQCSSTLQHFLRRIVRIRSVICWIVSPVSLSAVVAAGVVWVPAAIC